MLFLERILDTKEGTANERTDLHIFIKCIKNVKEKKKQWNCRWDKMSKAIVENK